MTLEKLNSATCLIGLSYFNSEGHLLKQKQLAGTVIKVDDDEGITIQLMPVANGKPETESKDTNFENKKLPSFILPPNLSAWFTAPKGDYKHSGSGIDLTDPDYLVTWDIHQTKKESPEGQHTWWQWTPRTVPPSVGL